MTSSTLVFTAVEASNATTEYVDHIRKGGDQGMPIYINGMDYDPESGKGFLPVVPGELITVLGRPGSGKSSLLMRWARMRAGHLKHMGVDNKIVLYMTAEQLVEELRLFHVAAELRISITDMAAGKLEPKDWGRVQTHLASPHMMTSPLWFIGKSKQRRRDKTEITETTLRDAMGNVEEWQGNQVVQEIDSIFIDYLQRFRPRGSAWVEFYGDLVNGLKNLAEDFNTRMVLGCQAKREVDTRQVPIPMMDDGQWTSTVEQFSDGVLSVVRPSHYVTPDDKTPPGFGKKDAPLLYVKDHNDMIVSVLKRKKGPENFKKFVKFEPEYNYLVQGEMKYYDPERDNDSLEEANA
jgi:replicative DNA helicase